MRQQVWEQSYTNDVSRLRKPAKFYLREDCEFAILLDYFYLYRYLIANRASFASVFLEVKQKNLL